MRPGVKGEKLKEDITKKNNFEYNYIFYIQNLIKVYLCVLASLSLSINLKSSLNVRIQFREVMAIRYKPLLLSWACLTPTRHQVLSFDSREALFSPI